MTTATETAKQITDADVSFLEGWIEQQCPYDNQEMVREAMLMVIGRDPEFWLNQSLWSVYNHAQQLLLPDGSLA